ncbi:type III secretion system gatekeeper subunit SctW [Pseudomonas chlororaphis]|uniref:type III secretion system gatekeeper subunit SctW n=1 Tax=Pseudomonas chlororaphis TaxID=587753 RepID=UPI000D0E8A3B|nr:type III secretion system gatekeeper subunit SctW [Pseudomonas chlororaphis]AVO60244.1 SepL/TyeA/HrpJ family type III secretion system gatekeeper [Pseudomonas chlororaphis subsp. piscium]
MITKTDSASIKPTPLIQNPAPLPLPGATQVFPAQSALELARTEFDMQATGLDFIPTEVPGDALSETLENMGFALGSYRQATGRGTSDGKSERPRTRAMLQQLVKHVTATAPAQMEDLQKHTAAIDEASDLLACMGDKGLDAGEMALLLGTALGRKNLGGAQRKRLEEALSAVMEDDEWTLRLFNRLEFGSTGKNSFLALKQLYQRATSRRTRLVQWFEEFRQLHDRRRKLKTLIRTLAFELSAEGPAMDAQLGAVITDLKRIMLFFGMEDHCHRVARTLAIDGLDGDGVIGTLLEIVQQSWMHVDWLEQQTSRQVPDARGQYAYVRQMGELVKLMTDECFEDDEQRKMIAEVFSEYQEKLSDEGL